MSLLDLASLVLAPTATKEGKVYSSIPDTGDGDLSFTRSNDTATRVNSAGLIEKVRTNLALYSEEFDNAAYVKFRSSITANSIANPLNGATTADKIVEDTANNLHRAGQGSLAVTSGVPITFSFYAKAGERTFLEVQRINTSGTVFNSLTNNVINLSTGVIPTISGATSSGSVSMGNGWYRYFITLTPIASGTGGLNLGLAEDISTLFYLGNGTSGAFIFGFQAETGDIATDYIPTTSAAVSVGMTANVPRVDYSGGGCPKLLLEPQRSNLVTYSEQFDNAAWTKLNTSVTANTTTSPDGTLSADTILANGVSTLHAAQTNSISFITSTAYSFSVFAKKGTNNFIQLIASSAIGGMFANFDLNNGSLGTLGTLSGSNPTSSIDNYGNGWYRCTINFTATATTSRVVNLAIVTSASATRAEDNTLTTSIFLWGAQLEEGSYATSYIPTLSAVSTRGQDACSKTGISSLIGQTEGVIYVEGTIVAEDLSANRRIVSISDGSSANSIQVFNRLATNKLEVDSNVGGVSQFSLQSGDVGFNTIFKCALAYKENDIAFYVNGTQIGTDNSASIPATSKLAFSRGDLLFAHEGNINQAILFPTRLTNDELADLTTL